jgi:hypothetical protein
MMRARVPSFQSRPSFRRGVATIADGKLTLTNPANNQVIKAGIETDNAKSITEKVSGENLFEGQ